MCAIQASQQSLFNSYVTSLEQKFQNSVHMFMVSNLCLVAIIFLSLSFLASPSLKVVFLSIAIVSIVVALVIHMILRLIKDCKEGDHIYRESVFKDIRKQLDVLDQQLIASDNIMSSKFDKLCADHKQTLSLSNDILKQSGSIVSRKNHELNKITWANDNLRTRTLFPGRSNIEALSKFCDETISYYDHNKSIMMIINNRRVEGRNYLGNHIKYNERSKEMIEDVQGMYVTDDVQHVCKDYLKDKK